MINQNTGEVPIQSFKDWQQILNNTTNKVAVLVSAFKTLHPDCPIEDISDCGGRIAGMIKQRHDPGLILLKIWLTSPVNIAGSHLNYINAALKGNQPTGAKPENKYASGKYAAYVQR